MVNECFYRVPARTQAALSNSHILRVPCVCTINVFPGRNCFIGCVGCVSYHIKSCSFFRGGTHNKFETRMPPPASRRRAYSRRVVLFMERKILPILWSINNVLFCIWCMCYLWHDVIFHSRHWASNTTLPMDHDSKL